MVATQLRVIFGDTDQMGIVYYANYLRFFEAGRTEFIRAKGMSYRDFEERYALRLPVTEANVHYLQPARYDDLLRLEISLQELRRASVTFGYRLLRDTTLLATGWTVHACVDLKGTIQRLPAELATRISEGEAQVTHGGAGLTGGRERTPWRKSQRNS